MHWRKTDPLQSVGALFACGDAAVDAVAALEGKSALFRSLPIARGKDWIILLAGSVPGEESEATAMILPSLPGTLPLHEEAEGWWLPVGVECGVPPQARPALRQALGDAYAVAPPLALIPEFEGAAGTTRRVHVYPIRVAGTRVP